MIKRASVIVTESARTRSSAFSVRSCAGGAYTCMTGVSGFFESELMIVYGEGYVLQGTCCSVWRSLGMQARRVDDSYIPRFYGNNHCKSLASTINAR
jgi:hypothetical protein